MEYQYLVCHLQAFTTMLFLLEEYISVPQSDISENISIHLLQIPGKYLDQKIPLICTEDFRSLQ